MLPACKDKDRNMDKQWIGVFLIVYIQASKLVDSQVIFAYHNRTSNTLSCVSHYTDSHFLKAWELIYPRTQNRTLQETMSLSNGFHKLSISVPVRGLYQCKMELNGTTHSVFVDRWSKEENDTIAAIQRRILGYHGQPNVSISVVTFGNETEVEWEFNRTTLLPSVMAQQGFYFKDTTKHTLVMPILTSSHNGLFVVTAKTSKQAVYVRVLVTDCQMGLYGKQCNLSCLCMNGGVCQYNGKCQCLPGYYGNKCEQACENGRHGPNCSLPCSDANGACAKICYPDPIACVCTPGLTGEACNEVCNGSSYANDCQLSCKGCHNYTICDRKLGCFCSPGWHGSKCDQKSATQTTPTTTTLLRNTTSQKENASTKNGNNPSGNQRPSYTTEPYSTSQVLNSTAQAPSTSPDTGTTELEDTTTPSIPTTIPPWQRKQMACEAAFANWKLPPVSTCVTPFLDVSTCSKDKETSFRKLDLVNITNEYLVCKESFEKDVYLSIDRLLGIAKSLDHLGKQLAEEFDRWRSKTANEDKYRKIRFIYSKVVFESGIDFKWKDLKLPEYSRTDLFADAKWNKRNDTITLPYASIPAGLYQYSFTLYDNLYANFPSQEQVRLKEEWKSGHIIDTGTYIDYSVEDGLIYNPKHEINTALISLSLNPHPKSPVTSDVVIVFKHKKEGLNKPWCVYWQFLNTQFQGKDDGNGDGYWTNYGMSVKETNETHTVCLSNHLSIFAVLMEPIVPEDSTPADPFLVATTLLTVLSILILVVYIITMIILGCLRTVYSRIYLSMACACCLSQLVFVFALGSRDNWEKCSIYSLIMELCHVTVMSWTTNESIHQLSRLRYFFNARTNIDAFHNLFGWGFPFAVLVALLGYPHQTYTSLRFCWLYVEGWQMWYYCGPLFVLVLISSIIRLITYFHIRKDKKKISKDVNYARAWLSLKASMFILPVICAIWLIATFAVRNSDGQVGGVLMLALPLLNFMVGVLIFYFYFYKNDEVQDALIEQMKIRERKRLLRYEHLKGMSMKVTYTPGQCKTDEEEEETELGRRESYDSEGFRIPHVRGETSGERYDEIREGSIRFDRF